jgi:hypothetical protein
MSSLGWHTEEQCDPFGGADTLNDTTAIDYYNIDCRIIVAHDLIFSAMLPETTPSRKQDSLRRQPGRTWHRGSDSWEVCK